ncbi:hypothetical protein MD484_g4117, partial [Candolleomyces efflorescens]
MILIPSPKSKWTLILGFILYLAILKLSDTRGLTEGSALRALNDSLDQEARNFLVSTRASKQHFATARLQNHLNCDNSLRSPRYMGQRELSNASCGSYSFPFEALPDASTRICDHLAGKRIAFVGPLTTYHLHNIWLETLEEHEGHSLYCPGPEYCIFHHICFPGRNASTHMDGRKQKFPTNQELQETRSAVLQYTLSTTLVSQRDKLHDVYTRPIVDPLTGVRTRNYYWLRKAQKAHILVLSQGPVPAPAWSYSKYFRSTSYAYLDSVLCPWRPKALAHELVAHALNATLVAFLPALKEALQDIQGDTQIQKSLIIWHGHWALDPQCTGSGLPKYIPRFPQFWTSDQDLVDPWSFYYNIQGLIIREDAPSVGEYIGHYIAKRINDFGPTPERPFVLGLPTGSSPIPTYQVLIKLVKEGKLSFKNVVTFNMDEYVGLPQEHPESYHSFMFRELFSQIDIPPTNVHILNGNAKDLVAECKEYEEKIKALGGVELFLGGIGEDGHIAFNEPGSSLQSRTRIKTLAYGTILANARFFDNDIAAVPHMALTVGVQTVLDSKEVVIVVTGQRKALALSKAIDEDATLGTRYNLAGVTGLSDKFTTDLFFAELRVKTVKYFKSIEKVQEEVDAMQRSNSKADDSDDDDVAKEDSGICVAS